MLTCFIIHQVRSVPRVQPLLLCWLLGRLWGNQSSWPWLLRHDTVPVVAQKYAGVSHCKGEKNTAISYIQWISWPCPWLPVNSSFVTCECMTGRPFRVYQRDGIVNSLINIETHINITGHFSTNNWIDKTPVNHNNHQMGRKYLEWYSPGIFHADQMKFLLERASLVSNDQGTRSFHFHSYSSCGALVGGKTSAKSSDQIDYT